MRAPRLALLLLGLSPLACTPAPAPDGGPDAGASDDAGARDGGASDGGQNDGGEDAGSDAGPGDGGAPDAGDDGGVLPPDGGPSEFCGLTFEPAPFPGCPGAEAYVGDATWPVPVEVPQGSLYCSTFEEGRELNQEPGFKGQLYFAPGEYRLPGTAGSYEATLPLCFQLSGLDAPALDGVAALAVEANPFGDRHVFRWNFTQPLDANGAPWTLQLQLELLTSDETPSVSLDGSYDPPFDPNNDALTMFVQLCEGDSCDTPPSRRFFAPCGFDVVEPTVHTIAFTGGEVELDLRIGESIASTEPASFSRAAGTLDGTAFVVEDYWRLVYNPEHHHERRDFIVLFDEPIGAAAGLRVVDVDRSQPVPARVHTVGCDLSPLEERAVTSEEVVSP